MSEILGSKQDELIFGDPDTREQLARKIVDPEDDRMNALTCGFVSAHPRVHGLLNASMRTLFEDIRALVDLLTGFPSVDFDIMTLDAEAVKNRFAEARARAQEVYEQMMPVITLSKSIQDEGVGVQSEFLGCALPDSVIDYPLWLSNCITCCDVVCEATVVGRGLDWFSLLPENLALKPINIRILRCFDPEDPVGRHPFGPYVRCPHLECEDVLLEDGCFRFPERLRSDTDYFIGYYPEEFPCVELCPIDNYAQLIYDLIEAREEDSDEVRDALPYYRGRFIIPNTPEFIRVPEALLAAAGLNNTDPIPCTLFCTDRLYELYEPNAYNKAIDGLGITLEMFMEK